jgi:acyl carrier protein
VPEGEEIDALVISLVHEVVPWRIASRGVANSASLTEDLGIDSLGMVTLAFRIGEELGLEIDDEDVDLTAIQTVADVQATARRLLERDRGPA